MIIEISVAVASLSFVVLTVFLVIYLRAASKSLEQIELDISVISMEASELVRNLNEVTEDVKEKVSSLNSVFSAFDILGKHKAEKRALESSEKIAEIIGLIGSGIDLVQRVKGDIKRYVKS